MKKLFLTLIVLLSAFSGLAAIYVKQPNQSDKIYYAHRDHLGSILSLTDANGTAAFKASYDAWGNQTITTNTFKFHRGYTGHEHLPEFALINMNGRMYDPVLGRFLSPDPYVQAPDFSQSFNRYSYCLNNPLMYTDPSRELFGIDDLIIAMAVSAVLNVHMQGMAGNLKSGGDLWKAAGIGALSGAGGGAVLGGISGGITAYRHGGNLLTGEGATFISDLEDSMFGIVDADQSPLNTNEKVMELLNKKSVKLSDYNVSFVDVESDLSGIPEKDFVYWRSKGIIYKVSSTGGEQLSIAGTTISRVNNFKPISSIYMSTHNTIPNFMKSLNHEFIHAWQFARFGYTNAKEWNAFKETSAYLYTQLYKPFTQVPSYSGRLWWKHLYNWPKLPSVY